MVEVVALIHSTRSVGCPVCSGYQSFEPSQHRRGPIRQVEVENVDLELAPSSEHRRVMVRVRFVR